MRNRDRLTIPNDQTKPERSGASRPCLVAAIQKLNPNIGEMPSRNDAYRLGNLATDLSRIGQVVVTTDLEASI